MAKTRTEKIACYEEQIKQLEAQRKQLIQKEKEQERKDRTKRLCWRMGLFESLLPDTITLTDDLFKTFLEKTVLSESASKLLSALLNEQNAAAATPIRASTAAQSAATATAKIAETARESGANLAGQVDPKLNAVAKDEGEDGGNGARATG